MAIRGFVDSITSTQVVGWAYAPGTKGNLIVQATLNQEIVGEAVANLRRADLAAAGLGDGNCGYAIKLHREIDPLFLPFLVVRPEGGDVEFPRTSIGYAEFFRSIYQRYPAAGRQRSIYGGLWTDRTDAAAMLRGKLTIGMIDAALSLPLNQMISAGFAVVPVGDGLGRSGEATPFLELAAQTVDQPGLLEMLQVVLEDVPVVIIMTEVTSSDESLIQASSSADLRSPAECLALLVPATEKGIFLDTVRESHLLPEFMPHGYSRWTSPIAQQTQPISGNMLLERTELRSGFVALVSPGTIHRVRLKSGGQTALRMTVVPSRAVPVTKVLSARREHISKRGVKFLITA
jgi:hypothetical protein